MIEHTGWSRDLRVTADGRGVVALAGSVGLRMLADRTGLTAGLSRVLTRRGFSPVHDRGRVLADLAVAVACGARDIVDIEALRAQRDLFGPVASDTTALRALGEVGGHRTGRIAAVRAAARTHLWNQLPEGPPPVTIAGDVSLGATVVLRVDATLVEAHSRKQQAAATYRKGYGHHPLGCWISNTGELAALMLRAGNANANTAADLITVLRQAIAQVPARWRARLLVTSDGAGFSHELVNWLTARNHAADRHVEYSIGWPIDADTRAAITAVRKDCWLPAVDNLDGSIRDDLQVAEVTGLLCERLARGGWPAGLRVFVRRRRLPAGQQHTLFDLDGYAYSAFATNTSTGMSIQLLDARHRGHARVEDDVRTTKDTGLAHLPSHQFAVNQAWCLAVAIAVDLLAWLRLLGPPQLARCEPATLRYRLLHVPARLTRGQRRRWLRLPASWPWAHALAAVIASIRAIPLPPPQPG